MREISPEELNERMRGFATHTGVVIEAATPGSGTVSLELSEKTRNPNGTVHGGVYFTLMDVAAGVSVSGSRFSQNAGRTSTPLYSSWSL